MAFAGSARVRLTGTLRTTEVVPPWEAHDPRGELQPPTTACAWRSNGGITRAHPARARPFSLEVSPPELAGSLLQIHLVGVFAEFAHAPEEPLGTVGAVLTLARRSGAPLRVSLSHGRHYLDARQLAPIRLAPGDGTLIETIGQTLGEEPLRVDCLTLDVPADFGLASLKLTDLGSPASYWIYGVFFDSQATTRCPFHPAAGVSLSELGAAVRINDRATLALGLAQLDRALKSVGQDLDEARGTVLTYLAVIAAARLESGEIRVLHKFQLEACRLLERADDLPTISSRAHELIADLLGDERAADTTSGRVLQHTLRFLERSFAQPISDETLARQLALSTSHFRFLFREATGQPFGRYLVGYRLERARAMLSSTPLSVAEVARACGFQSASHFSRAFSDRFKIAPSVIRRADSGGR